MADSPEQTTSHSVSRLLRSIRFFLNSQVRLRARLLLISLLTLMLCINALNVWNSYTARYFFSAIESHDNEKFHTYTLLYLGIFAASALTACLFRFTEERLALLWREWLTRRTTRFYIEQQLYKHLTGEFEVTNADQRITEDIKQLTTMTLSFFLMLLNGTITTISFSGVLWSISPKLFIVAVIYAALGSMLTIRLGKPLIQLNYKQSDYEANFRSELIIIHEKNQENQPPPNSYDTLGVLNKRIDSIVLNMRKIIAINRNLNFFSSGYNYLIQIIPVVIVAPLFIERKVDFGIIGQSTMAFSSLLGAFSLIITQFQTISSYASVISRLGELATKAENHPDTPFTATKHDPLGNEPHILP